MASGSSDEINQQKTNEENNESNSNNEDHSQRKRSRIGSHLEEEINPNLNNKKNDEIIDEVLSTSVENNETSENKNSIKRRKLNVDIEQVVEQDEKTNDSIQTRTTTTTTSDETKSESSTTTDDEEDDETKNFYDEDEDENDDDDENSIEENNLPPVKNICFRLRQRELGIFHKQKQRSTCRAFHNDMIANRYLVQRMKVSHLLDGHNGCVNALAFNRIGTLLASASDDLQVILWDWAVNQPVAAFDSEHHSNVFQAKFIPFSDDCKIVTCARDGQVRLAELRPDGSILNTKEIARHNQSAHKLSVDTITGNDVFSCGEDGLVFQIDLREKKSNKLVTVNDGSMNKLPLYSIDFNRNNQNEFVLAGMDPYVRVYDRRFIESILTKPMKNFCPDLIKKIEDRQSHLSVTCAVYNYNGTEILGSYNDEDIYLFNSSHSDGADAIHRYFGHRNSNTVKGVNFYGRNSEFVISGSDCGNVFIWDKYSEKCIWFSKGDDDGTVNVLEPHPNFPIIATSGLEHDVKIWAPTNTEPVDFKRLKTIMKRNAREREHERHITNVFDADTGSLFRLMRPVLRRIARRANVGEGNSNENDDDDDDDDENDDDDDVDFISGRRQIYPFDCAPS